MDKLKSTALTELHRTLGAKMVPFAGYEMPLQYKGLLDEHHAVRNNSGMFDVSHMGEFLVQGKDALGFLQKVTSNDVSKLSPGKIQYSCMPNAEHGIVDDLLVYCLDVNKYMLVVNASNIDKDWSWLQSYASNFDVKMENNSDSISLLAVQGPKVAELLQSLTEVNLGDMTYYTFQRAPFAGVEDVIISATGYTGAGGFEIYLRNEAAEQVWNAISALGVPPAGLAARDTLRLEKGFCLYGNDINDTTHPLEAGLGWITKFTKEFIQSDSLLVQKEEGLKRRLVGFGMIDRGIPRQHYPIVDKDDAIIGEVTSGTQSPSLNRAIGMGYVHIDHSKAGSEIFIQVRGKSLKAVVEKIPFVQ
jgi:aminomethyltransferase